MADGINPLIIIDMMKIKLFIAFCALCTITLLASCEKDADSLPKNALLLTTEKYSDHNGEKVSVSDLSVQWVDGDTVNLNLAPYKVHVSDGKAYVDGNDLINKEVCGFSPASLLDGISWDATNKRLTLTFPNHYTSSYVDGGRQKIGLPMAAYASNAVDGIEFKHLSAAVKVLVKNTTTNALILDKVVVSSSAYKLSGSTIVTLDPENVPVVPTESTSSSNSVTVSFSSPVTLSANEGNTVEVQVPVRPIGTSNLTIEIYAHRQGEAIGISGVPAVRKTVVYHFNHADSSPALARNVLLTAKVQIQSTTPTTEIDNSLFTIDAEGHQVRFSKGNLKQNGSSWSFHTKQYDLSATQDDTERDLFQWSVASGWNSSTSVEGNTGWRVLTSEEWNYLINSRSGSRFAKASVAGVNGLILFPDSYVQPYGITLNYLNVVSLSSGGSANFSDFNSFSDAQWTQMEAAGAIFLPAVHNSGGKGHYWSSTSQSDDDAKRLYFSNYELGATAQESKTNTCSIRLVKSN